MGEGAEPDRERPSDAEVRTHLARLLHNERFTRSEGLCRFLRHTIEETLAGRGAGIKEQVLGIEVFGRGDQFDARLDPIVRVQASRLRARLKAYYESEGSSESIIVEYPKGSYTPIFYKRPSI